MVSLSNIDLKISKIKKSLENSNSNNLLMFVEESDDPSYAEIYLQYNGKSEIINCYSIEEYENILERFKSYSKQIFFGVRKPAKGSIYEFEEFF